MYKYRQNLMNTSSYTCSGYCYQEAQNEAGRSMVEMLGVLSVMGVLSVSGIAGYTFAMNKYRANELLNEASKRAVVVATQAMQKRATYSLGEFGKDKVQNADLGVVKVDDKHFAITISQMDQAVCQNVLGAIGNNTPVRQMALAATPTQKITSCGDDGTAYALVYNNDLSVVDAIFDPNTPADIGSHGYRCSGATIVNEDTDATVTECVCSEGESYYGTEGEAISELCYTYHTYVCSGNTIINDDTDETVTNCFCPDGASYYGEEEGAVSVMCQGEASISYRCSGATIVNEDTDATVTECVCSEGESYYGTEGGAISELCYYHTYVCSGGGTIVNEDTDATVKNCSCSDGASYYGSEEGAVSEMCQGEASIYNSYYCSAYMSGAIVLDGTMNIVSYCSCSWNATYYGTEEDAILNLCNSQDYYCADGAVINNDTLDVVVSCNCPEGATYYGSEEGAVSTLCYNMYPSAYDYLCSGGDTIVNENTDEIVTNCSCFDGLSYYGSEEDAISNLCH